MPSSTGGEFRGKTVEEAIKAGLAALKLKQNQVEIEVLSKGSRGLLGFGAEDAHVRITPIVKEKPAPEPKAPAKPAKSEPPPAPPAPPKKIAPEAKSAAPKPEKPAAISQPAPAKAPEKAPVPAAKKTEGGETDIEAIAVELLQGMLDRMEVNATVRVVEHQGVLDAGQEAPLVLNIEGDDLGILIGRRGETLAAIQYLLRLMINHRVKHWTSLVVDVEGYKARREEQLQKLAERMAERVIQSGRAVAMEAMPARERRIVHIALRNHPQVTTQSVGEGENRKVTVIPRK